MFTLDNLFYGVTLDWIKGGLTKIFVIIAVLQLVKKIPDIINTVFGTHIQSRGGIKGRLGEMAAVGGLAQKAWTSLGTGAKNLAKTLATAPVALGALGADKIYKSTHNGQKLLDNKNVRQIRGLGSALRSAWKTGSVSQVAKSYEEGKKAPSYSTNEIMSAQNIASRNIRDKINDAVGGDLINEDGSWNNEFKNKKTGKTEFIDPSKAQKAMEIIEKELSDEKYGEAGKHAAAKMRAQLNQNIIEGINKRNEQAQTSFNNASLKLREQHPNLSAQLDVISAKIRDGKTLTAQEYDFLNSSQLSNLQDIIDAKAQIKKMENEAAFARNFVDGYDGSTGSIALGTIIGRQAQVVASEEKEYQKAVSDMSVVDKNAIDMMLTKAADAKDMFNGGIQNTGQVESIYNVKDFPRDSAGNIIGSTASNIYADIEYHTTNSTDPTKTFYKTSAGTPIPYVDSNVVRYITNIREGIVVPSAGDYKVDISDNDTLAEYNDVVASVKSTVGTAGYYAELHDALKKSVFSTNADVMDAIDKMEKSGFLPLPSTGADYGISETDFSKIESNLRSKGFVPGTKSWFDKLNATIKYNYKTDSTVQARVHTYETNYRLPE